MTNEEKVSYFNENLKSIFSHHSNNLIGFITEYLEIDDTGKEIKKWPDDIKILIVNSYLQHL